MTQIANMAGVVDRLATGTYEVRRRAAGGIVKGKVQPSTETTSTVVACVQPLTGEELERLPEGERTREHVTVHTSVELRTSGDGYSADLIVIDGEPYEIQTVEKWGTQGGYYKSIAARGE